MRYYAKPPNCDDDNDGEHKGEEDEGDVDDDDVLDEDDPPG